MFVGNAGGAAKIGQLCGVGFGDDDVLQLDVKMRIPSLWRYERAVEMSSSLLLRTGAGPEPAAAIIYISPPGASSVTSARESD